MYGLMKSRACSQTAQQKYQRRLHYCGACKSIGRIYGQKARMLLNHDAVFLGELLSKLNNDGQPLKDWTHAFQSYNCLALPNSADEIPRALQFAAAANIILTEFKITDQVFDSDKRRWRIARRVLDKNFRAASAQLAAWDFPLADLWRCLHIQNEREAGIINAEIIGSDARLSEEILHSLSEPTADATALVFRHGTRFVGTTVAAQETMHTLGFAFGKLVYLLDAFEDYEKDFARGEFNALRTAYHFKGAQLSTDERRTARQTIIECEREVIVALENLSIAAEQVEIFRSRLKYNLDAKLERTLPLLKTSCASKSKAEQSFGARWQQAKSVAREISVRHLASNSKSILKRIQVPLVFASVVLIALVFPHQTTHAKSYRECLDLSFNSMNIGAALSAFVIPFNVMMSEGGDGVGGGDALPTVEEITASNAKRYAATKGGGSSSWCGGCNCNDCNCCCDSCCECGDCCSSCDCC